MSNSKSSKAARKNYVLHFCKNKECNNGWLDIDKTNVKDYPPHWKYCEECCKKLGIDFNKQTPKSNASIEKLKAMEIGSNNLSKH